MFKLDLEKAEEPEIQIANIRWIIEKAREFQRIARRDKKAFFSNQCKEIEEKNRMGKPRDLFEKIRDTKGTFHAKMVNKGQKWYGPSRSRRY